MKLNLKHNLILICLFLAVTAVPLAEYTNTSFPLAGIRLSPTFKPAAPETVVSQASTDISNLTSGNNLCAVTTSPALETYCV